MKVGVTGFEGRLGSVLVGMGCIPCSLYNADKFDVIIHAAAYTKVDQAETDIGRCMQSNAVYTDKLRRATDAKIIYISTDFVFDGLDGPYGEWSDENPQSIYGLF